MSYGRHFGRTVHPLANIKALITNGVLRMGELADEPEEFFTAEYVNTVAARKSHSINTDTLLDKDANIVSLRNF